MRELVRLLLISAVIVAGCSGSGVEPENTPTHLDDLDEMDYTDIQMVIDQLVCMSVIMTFHIGLGVSSEREAIESLRGVDSQDLVRRAEQVGDQVWALASETGQVTGALHSGGGVILCEREVADDRSNALGRPTSSHLLV